MAAEIYRISKEIDIKRIRTFFYFEHNRDYFFEGERHDFWEMVYVDRGQISTFADEKELIIPQGSVVFHKPMEFHNMESVGGKPHNVMVVSFDIDSPAMKFFENKILAVNPKQKKILSVFTDEMRKAFGNVYRIKEDREPNNEGNAFGSYGVAVSQLEYFLIDLIRCGSENEKKHANKKNTQDGFADVVEEYLKENIYGSLTLFDICNHFNISRSFLCSRFKERKEKSVIDYYIELKIVEAKLLIREGELNLTQIAEKLGYASIHHFTRSFKSKEKMSPREYANSIK